MSDDTDLNEHGNHQGEFHQTVGGWAEYTVNLTEIKDTVRHDVTLHQENNSYNFFARGYGKQFKNEQKRQKYLDKTG